MVNLIFQLFLRFNATSLVLVIYLIKNKKLLNGIHQYLIDVPPFISYIIYTAITILLTFLSLLLSKWLSNDNIEVEDGASAIKEIEEANNTYVPTYLSYFFVALGIPNLDSLLFVFLVLFLLTFISEKFYFNPLFLIFGYKFYRLTTVTNIKIFLITRKQLKDPSLVNLPLLKRINDFTFIDKEK